MKKMKLDLDDLKVESFETTAESQDGEGTVYGYITQDLTQCGDCTNFLCEPTNNRTCGSTCGPTCGNTCGNTCPSTCNNTCGSTCTCGNGVTCLGECNTDFACFICTRIDC